MVRNDIKNSSLLKTKFLIYAFNGRTDFRKADWLKAIKEDGAIWQQLLLKGDARKQVLAAYSIVSIPQILLVSPDGTIIAKDLRGNKIYEAVQKTLAK